MDTEKIPWGFVLHFAPGGLWIDIAETEQDSQVEAEGKEIVVPLTWSEASYINGFLSASMGRCLEEAIDA